MSLIISLLSIGSMSHVDFKKWPCRRVEFRGQGPSWWSIDSKISIHSCEHDPQYLYSKSSMNLKCSPLAVVRGVVMAAGYLL